jgi:hypothetical protein
MVLLLVKLNVKNARLAHSQIRLDSRIAHSAQRTIINLCLVNNNVSHVVLVPSNRIQVPKSAHHVP